MPHSKLSPIEDILDDARSGRMFILIDDEDRENEGDLIIPAQFATPEAVNFMAKHGRGLICLAMTEARVNELSLNLMSRSNNSRHQTAFTVSIEAREGVTTGISAADRAHTIQVAIDPTRNARDIASPGHVFPLVAREGGVLVRAGHTEAAVDISRLAGLNPSGVICEVMNDDGTMARLPDLVRFAHVHGLRIATIASLIEYRRRQEKLVSRSYEGEFHSLHGQFRLIAYRSALERVEHVALVKGDIAGGAPVWVRMHAENPLADSLGDAHAGRGMELRRALEMIEAQGRGVVVLLRDDGAEPFSARLKARENEGGNDLRDYGIGAQILLDLGVRDMMLISNAKRPVIGLEGYGLSIAGYLPIA